MAKRDAVFPSGRQALYDQNAYSAAVRSGDFLFVSGQVGSREDGSPEPDFAAQVQLAFDNLQSVLEAAGGKLRRYRRCDDLPYRSRSPIHHHHGSQGTRICEKTLPQLDRGRRDLAGGFRF